MTTKDEALKLALEALEQIDEAMPFPVAKLAQKVIREALAEQPAQQEPVAWMVVMNGVCNYQLFWSKPQADALCTVQKRYGSLAEYHVEPLYTSPPAKPWVGLTDEEVENGRDQTFSINNPYCPCDSKTMRKAVRWAEAKLKEKNT